MKRWFGIFLLLGLTTSLACGEDQAVAGVVSGNVQKVGFRAFVLRQAIAQNLTGWTCNLPDGRVSFALYGKPDRITQALSKIGEGPERSTVEGVQSWKTSSQSAPATFTVFGWTSETRNLHVPRDLVFQPRTDDSVLDEHKTKKAYHEILKAAGVEDP